MTITREVLRSLKSTNLTWTARVRPVSGLVPRLSVDAGHIIVPAPDDCRGRVMPADAKPKIWLRRQRPATVDPGGRNGATGNSGGPVGSGDIARAGVVARPTANSDPVPGTCPLGGWRLEFAHCDPGQRKRKGATWAPDRSSHLRWMVYPISGASDHPPARRMGARDADVVIDGDGEADLNLDTRGKYIPLDRPGRSWVLNPELTDPATRERTGCPKTAPQNRARQEPIHLSVS